MKYKEGAIVIGGHFQGLGLIRALASRGVRVVLIDNETSAGRFSRYVEKFFYCPSVLEEKEFLEFLIWLGTKKGLSGWVIFPTDDETVSLLSRHRKKLAEIFRVTTPEWDIVKYVYNKKLSYPLAKKIGLSIPETFYPEKIEDLSSFDLSFPVIIKPAVMRNFFRKTGKKVFLARNYSELKIMYRKATEIIEPSEVLIQELIPDVAHHLYSFCPFFKDKKVLGRVIAQRIRQHPMDFGHASTLVKTVNIPELEILGTRFLSAINYYGLCEVEFIQDPRDGKFKFLEVNPRIWGWHTIAVRAGVNLPYLVYLDMMDKAVGKDSFKTGVKWIRLITDTPTALSEILKKRLGLYSYLKSLKGINEFAVFSFSDPLPFFGELMRLPYLWKKRGF